MSLLTLTRDSATSMVRSSDCCWPFSDLWHLPCLLSTYIGPLLIISNWWNVLEPWWRLVNLVRIVFLVFIPDNWILLWHKLLHLRCSILNKSAIVYSICAPKPSRRASENLLLVCTFTQKPVTNTLKNLVWRNLLDRSLIFYLLKSCV